ncbi:type II secretion system F family protein, partial [Staphylococcus epidermidis]|uniref:type II secretion system F family protein n=9 Tax=Staphylococcus TaxID=1279 RepID=UPI00163C447F
MKKLSINTFKYKRNKYLTEIQSINLLQRLHQLLSHGFTLYQSFKFLNSYFKYKERTINEKIIQHLQNGATCYDILKMIGYPELVLLQIKFAENYGNIDEALVDTVQYMKRNLKAKKRLIKTLQYPVALISIFLFILTILNITVIPQFQQLYETMNVKLSTFQNLLTLIITLLPKLTFIFIFMSGIAFF